MFNHRNHFICICMKQSGLESSGPETEGDLSSLKGPASVDRELGLG